jgi:polysaccharide biosynthesis/export protein
MRFTHNSKALSKTLMGVSLLALALSGCANGGNGPQLPPAPFNPMQEGPGEDYVIGPLDQLSIHVWRNPELSTQVQVRPDGRVTTPLISDMPAVGKTPTMLAQDIKLQLGEYIRDPIVSVTVTNFASTGSQQVRIMGATEKPRHCRSVQT